MTSPPPARGRLLDPELERMNKTEADYATLLDLRKQGGEIHSWQFEAIRLRMADGAFYKPDFLVQDVNGYLELHEVKGHWREAAKVRIKVAAALYPMFRFVVVYRRGPGLAGFDEKEVKP